jgi:CheY-like chemotaxis protein
MPIVLVVDDSAVDRKLIEGLLKMRLDWIVEFAENGSHGLELVGQLFPDVVITDLQMPEMNGMQLCAEIKSEYPQVPVILITGEGSEDLAVEALAAGAASFVPKTELANSLLETIEQVLCLSRHLSPEDLLMQYITQSRFQFSLDNDQNLITPVVDFIVRNLEGLKIADETEGRHFAVALEEALINAMFHGNLELPSAVVQEARRALHQKELSPAVQERLADPKFRERKIRMAVEFSRKEVKVVIRDDGQGFQANGKNLAGIEPEHFSKAGGKGLTLIQSFMDEVQFNEAGNEIRMVMKRRNRFSTEGASGIS